MNTRGMSAPDGTRGACAGLKVLDLATLFPAPLLAAMLGDLGADVVKVEPPGGDPLRGVGTTRDGASSAWALAGRNKRSITVDLDTVEGVTRVVALSSVADVIVVNQPAHVLARWRCTYDEVHARNPAAVFAAVSAFGATGPLADRPGNGTIAEAFGAFASLNGPAGGPPTLPSVALGDALAALTGLAGVLAACYWRDARGGEGQFVDVSMYEPVMGLLASTMVGWDPSTPAPERFGSRVHGAVPRNVYRTADDSYVAVSGATDAQVARLLHLMERESPADLARFARSGDRLRHADELDAAVAKWIAEHDLESVLDRFIDARVPIAPVNDLASLVEDAHVRARDGVVELNQASGQRVLMPAPAPKLSATPAGVRRQAPGPNAHAHEILAEWLGNEPSE